MFWLRLLVVIYFVSMYLLLFFCILDVILGRYNRKVSGEMIGGIVFWNIVLILIAGERIITLFQQ